MRSTFSCILGRIVVVLVAVLPVGAVWQTADAEPADAYLAHYWQWNIFGTCAGGNCGNLYAAQVLHFNVASNADLPFVITLNEVCDRQFSYLFAQLGAMGYRLRYSKTNGLPGPPAANTPPVYAPFQAVNCGTNNGTGQFGNALAMLGTESSRPADYYYPANKQTAADDWRSLSCMSTGTFFGVRKACVTHIDPGPSDIRFAQDDTAAFISTLTAANEYLVVGADRNTTITLNWTSFTNSDPSTPWKPTWLNVSPTLKLDWVFGGPGHGAFWSLDPYCPPNHSPKISDHCMVRGRFTI
jgi:hypothetical protein